MRSPAFGIPDRRLPWWLQGLVGLDRTGPIESFLPVIVFAILFGLSMDYEVFLVSRIREEYVHGAKARPAITRGIGAIGRVVVAAALIMSVVFLSFLLGEDRIIKEFGLALGLAILIDAFVIRLVLVPAVMHLMDERMWYMPRWLDRRCRASPSSRRPARPRRPISRARRPSRRSRRADPPSAAGRLQAPGGAALDHADRDQHEPEPDPRRRVGQGDRDREQEDRGRGEAPPERRPRGGARPARCV